MSDPKTQPKPRPKRPRRKYPRDERPAHLPDLPRDRMYPVQRRWLRRQVPDWLRPYLTEVQADWYRRENETFIRGVNYILNRLVPADGDGVRSDAAIDVERMMRDLNVGYDNVARAIRRAQRIGLLDTVKPPPPPKILVAAFRLPSDRPKLPEQLEAVVAEHQFAGEAPHG